MKKRVALFSASHYLRYWADDIWARERKGRQWPKTKAGKAARRTSDDLTLVAEKLDRMRRKV